MLKICLNFRGSEIPKRVEKGWFFYVIWQLKDHILICYCSFAVLNPARDSRVSQIWAILCLKNCGSRLWKRTDFFQQKLDLFLSFPLIPNMTYFGKKISWIIPIFKCQSVCYQYSVRHMFRYKQFRSCTIGQDVILKTFLAKFVATYPSYKKHIKQFHHRFMVKNLKF